MKRYTYANKDDDFFEKRIAIGAIVSEPLLMCLCDERFFKWEYIASEAIQTVIEWCLDYYEDNGKPPKDRIQDIFEDEADNNDSTELKRISRLLDRASKEYERDEHNDALFVSSAEQYFRSRREVIVNEIKAEMIAERESADKIASIDEQYPIPTVTQINTQSIFRDKDYLFDILDNERNRPLFTIPGMMGKMFEDSLVRQGFIAFLGDEKVGKSWLLLYLAVMAAKGKLNVLFVSAGDMSKENVDVRLAISLTKRSNKAKYCMEHYEPCMDCQHNQRGTCPYCDAKVPSLIIKDDSGERLAERPEEAPEGYETHHKDSPDLHGKGCEDFIPTTWFRKVPACTPLSEDREGAWKELQNVRRMIKKRGLEVEFAPTATLTVEDLDAMLKRYESNGTIMDVVVVDYADIMADEKVGYGEARHVHSTRWKKLRRFAQVNELLLITATQSNRRDGGGLKGRNDISEDKSKMAEVTAFYGINQTKKDKRYKRIALNQFAGRDGDYDEECVVWLLQNLQRGQVNIDSYFGWWHD